MGLMLGKFKNNHTVSIVIPCHNCEEYIHSAIYSVIQQSYSDWHMIVVDDWSSDDTVPIIKKLQLTDQRIDLVELKSNMGAGFARNVGLKNALGRFVAFLDGDDIWMPEKLQHQIEFMLKDNVPICYSSYIPFNSEHRVSGKVVRSIPKVNLDVYLRSTIIGMSTSVIDTNIVGRDIRFSFLKLRQDADFWIKLLKKGHIAHGIYDPLVRYRVHKNSLSANKIKAVVYTFWLYFVLHRLGIFNATFYFYHYLLNAIKKRGLNR